MFFNDPSIGVVFNPITKSVYYEDQFSFVIAPGPLQFIITEDGLFNISTESSVPLTTE